MIYRGVRSLRKDFQSRGCSFSFWNVPSPFFMEKLINFEALSPKTKKKPAPIASAAAETEQSISDAIKLI